jgi:hypothetical protein
MKRILACSCLGAWLLVLGAGCGSDNIKDAKDIKIAPVETHKGKKDAAGMGKEDDMPIPQGVKKGG